MQMQIHESRRGARTAAARVGIYIPSGFRDSGFSQDLGNGPLFPLLVELFLKKNGRLE